ncbi:nucleic acid-binding, OB-fold protein [Artemisia annua]|uniref:Nucleic acid-binding, OB-fold protein n=1 Tax=Artemisia annua TaxID=35608 RepID=A0A2U1QDG7_ARTAN|nr:nucleic acid-binding, OB-fold protein [Artemisia annua]
MANDVEPDPPTLLKEYIVSCLTVDSPINILKERGRSIEVFNLNDSKNEWEKVDGLGKHMIYISSLTCLCIEAKAPHMDNKIYFPRLHSGKIVFYSLQTCRYHTFNGKMDEESLVDLAETEYHTNPHVWIIGLNQVGHSQLPTYPCVDKILYCALLIFVIGNIDGGSAALTNHFLHFHITTGSQKRKCDDTYQSVHASLDVETQHLDNCSSGHATHTFENLQPLSTSPYVNIPNPEKNSHSITSKTRLCVENENTYPSVGNKRKGCQQDPFASEAAKKLKGELPDRVIDPKEKPKKPYPVLTDYIGCYIRSGDKGKVGNPNKTQSVQRKVEIQNLNRNSLELTLWGDLAEKFNKERIDALEQPIIIAVSSCRVSRYNNNLQLQSTAATYFYINPRIPQLEQYRAEYRELHNLRPPLQIIKHAFQDKEKEKTRNRIPLADLIQEKPDTHMGVRFTCDGTIQSINTTREWYYVSCNVCTSKLDINEGVYRCSNHGPIPSPTYRYNFKLYITDNTETVMLTCFTPKAYAIVGTDCHSLVTSLTQPDPKEFPEKISSLVGKKHIFQFHFNTANKHGPPNFILNEILDKTDTQKQLEGTPSGSTSANEAHKAIQYEPDVSQTNTSASGTATPPPTVMKQEMRSDK